MPWLKYVPEWFPGAAWKKTVRMWRAERDEMVEVPFKWTKEQMVSLSENHPSVVF
jgi:hypothetical protein